MVDREYTVKVFKSDVKSRMFRYHIELWSPSHDFAIAHDWCGYKFNINRTAKKLLRKQFEKDNPNLIREFKARASRR